MLLRQFIPFLFAFFIVLPSPIQAQQTPESFADLAERLLPTVVNISSTQKIDDTVTISPAPNMPDFPMFPKGSPFEDFFEDFMNRHQQVIPNIPAASLGSGFIYDKENGIIITNNHVIKDADEIKVTLHNEVILPAELIGSDDKTDLAVLKVDLSNQNGSVADIQFGDSDELRVGDWVIAIGNPFGLGGTVTAGIVSARQRDIQAGPYDDFIQTDASINRGNSGGPMFNVKGELIGINTAIFSPSGGSVGIGFAIPSAMAEPIIKQLVEYGRTRRGWLGVRIQSVTDEIADSLGLAKAAGALVASITPTGPAEKAGIQSGDIILAFDNKPIRDMRSLPRIVAETEIGKETTVVVWRNGKRVDLKVTIGELEKAEESGLFEETGEAIPTEPEEPKGKIIPELGLTLTPLTPAMREVYGISDKINGLLVTNADINSDSAQKGLSEGDVIVDINQNPAKDIESFEKEVALAKQSKRESVLLLINRLGDIRFVAVRLEDKPTNDNTTEETPSQESE